MDTGPAPLDTTMTEVYEDVTATRRGPTFSLKVVKATMQRQGRGKGRLPANQPDILGANRGHSKCGTYTVGPSSVEHILGVISSQWGAEHTLVTNDGLEIEDSTATQGMHVNYCSSPFCMVFIRVLCTVLVKPTHIWSSELHVHVLFTTVNNHFCRNAGLTFWKNPRRKLFAVTKTDIKGGVSKRQPIVFDSDEDDDFEPRKKKPKTEANLEMILDEMVSIKDTLAEAMSLTKFTKIPLGLKRTMRDTFKCHICHCVPIVPPVIVTKCCKTILGCLNSWYSGQEALTKTCPSCRAERGYNETMLLLGLNDFLTEIRKAIQTAIDY